MSSLFELLKGTPPLAWVGLAYCIYKGIQANRERAIWVPQLFIMPIILLILKLKFLTAAKMLLFNTYLSCLLVTTFFAFVLAIKAPPKVASHKWEVIPTPSPMTLPLLVSFFVVKYTFGFLSATNFDLYTHIVIFEVAFSATISGFFLGKAIGYSYFVIKNS